MSVNWGMAGAVRPDPYGSYLDARDRREQRQEHMEDRQRQRTERSANEAWARALAADDLAAARNIAAKAGSPDAVQQVNDQVSRRVRQEAIRFNTELQGIAQLYAQDPEAAMQRYAQLYQGTLQRASHWGLDRIHPEAMDQFRATYVAPGDPSFGQRLPTMLQNSTQSVQGLMTEDMDPEDYWRMQQQGGERRYAAASGGILDTYTGHVVANPYYVRGTAGQSADPNSALQALGGAWDD